MHLRTLSPAAGLCAFALAWATCAWSGGALPQHQAWRAERDVFYLVFVRSFADSDGDRRGDFAGLERRLGYLQDLGVTSILLTPIVPSLTYHNYFASRFDAVDPAYGSLAAFHHLVRAVHARHMKIYLDEEIQYVEGDHPWWAESAGHPDSRYAGYVLFNGPGNTQEEKGFLADTPFVGYDGVPARIAVVNLELPAVRRYFADLFAWWLDPDGHRGSGAGVDGFRIDHMMDDLDNKGRLTHLNAGFWAPLFAHARSVNPAISIIAEQADWQYGDDLLRDGTVDIVYAFPLRKAIAALDRDAIAREIDATQAHTPPGKGQLVFIENHDTDRFASLVGGDVRRERLGAALNVLLKGTPLIYYGQEIGMKGLQLHGPGTDGNDIPVREAFRWTRTVDAPGEATWYRDTGPWWTDRHARDHDGISVEEQVGDPGSLLAWYRRLLALRRARAELREGDQRVIASDAPALLVVSRTLGRRESLLVVNCSAATVTGHIPYAGAHPRATPHELLATGTGAATDRNGLDVTVEPYGVRLLALH